MRLQQTRDVNSSHSSRNIARTLGCCELLSGSCRMQKLALAQTASDFNKGDDLEVQHLTFV